MGKRQIAAMQTRLKVIVAAKRLIEKNGFKNVTIDDITKEAKVAKGTFYTYFKRKEDVVSEIDDRVKAQTFFIHSLTADAQTLMSFAKSDVVQTECKKVYESIRYSDPMSNDALIVSRHTFSPTPTTHSSMHFPCRAFSMSMPHTLRSCQ